jgi:hypothetical protein
MENDIIEYPVIVIVKSSHFELWNISTLIEQFSLSLYNKNFYLNYEIFDKNNNKWIIAEMETNFKQNIFGKILTSIIDKRIEVKPVYKKVEQYDIEKLKKDIIKFIKKCDDVYTQFYEEKKLIKMVNETKNFNDLYQIIKNEMIRE